jgi:hypothetical protein
VATPSTTSAASSATPVRPGFRGLCGRWRYCTFLCWLLEYCFVSSFWHFLLGFIGLIV